MIVWGDSHAGEAIPGLDALGKELGKGALLISNNGCAPLVGWQIFAKGIRQENCTKNNDFAIRTIRNARPRRILASSLLPDGCITAARDGRTPTTSMQTYGRRWHRGRLFPSYPARIKAALSETVEALVASGVRRILLVGPHPQMVMQTTGLPLAPWAEQPMAGYLQCRAEGVGRIGHAVPGGRQRSSWQLYPQLRLSIQGRFSVALGTADPSTRTVFSTRTPIICPALEP